MSFTLRSNAIANIFIYMPQHAYTNITVASVFRSRIAGLKSGCICNCDRRWQISLPRWHNGKESACQCRRCGFDPWVGKIPWRRKWQPTPVFLPGKPHGGLQSMGVAKSQWLSTHTPGWSRTMTECFSKTSDQSHRHLKQEDACFSVPLSTRKLSHFWFWKIWWVKWYPIKI